MGAKKDPAKFTIRFNLEDPQQMMAAGLLERQGRCKAQFITNAVLFYTQALSDGQLSISLSSAMAQHIMTNFQVEHQEISFCKANGQKCDTTIPFDEDDNLEDEDLDSIRRTIDAFQTP